MSIFLIQYDFYWLDFFNIHMTYCLFSNTACNNITLTLVYCNNMSILNSCYVIISRIPYNCSWSGINWRDCGKKLKL